MIEREIIEYNNVPVLYACQDNVNMSKSFKGLGLIVEEVLKHKVRPGNVYVFFNTQRTKVKLLFRDKTGTCIVYKALDKDVFQVEYKQGFKKITAINPQKLLTEYLQNGHKGEAA